MKSLLRLLVCCYINLKEVKNKYVINKLNKFNIMKKKVIEILKYSTLIMETENHTDYYIDNIDEVADELVKLFAIPVVSISEAELCFNCRQRPSVNKHTSLCKECYDNWNKGKTIKTN